MAVMTKMEKKSLELELKMRPDFTNKMRETRHDRYGIIAIHLESKSVFMVHPSYTVAYRVLCKKRDNNSLWCIDTLVKNLTTAEAKALELSHSSSSFLEHVPWEFPKGKRLIVERNLYGCLYETPHKSAIRKFRDETSCDLSILLSEKKVYIRGLWEKETFLGLDGKSEFICNYKMVRVYDKKDLQHKNGAGIAAGKWFTIPEARQVGVCEAKLSLMAAALERPWGTKLETKRLKWHQKRIPQIQQMAKKLHIQTNQSTSTWIKENCPTFLEIDLTNLMDFQVIKLEDLVDPRCLKLLSVKGILKCPPF